MMICLKRTEQERHTDRKLFSFVPVGNEQSQCRKEGTLEEPKNDPRANQSGSIVYKAATQRDQAKDDCKTGDDTFEAPLFCV